MERKIGEIFEYDGEWYQCLELKGCISCYFYNSACDSIRNVIGSCTSGCRSDTISVIFKKLKKVGKPYFNGQYGEVLQEYKYYIPPITPDLRIHIIKLGIVGIEIKQNKEDMREKKLNLKPFDIQKAREGKPVCTRDGRKARIICFDLKNDEYPIVAAVENDSSETLFSYTTNGEIADGTESDKDLMMLPEKKEGWVNIDKGGSGKITISPPYSTKEEAIHNDNECTIDTIRINWSE